jgi:hypothetical protein
VEGSMQMQVCFALLSADLPPNMLQKKIAIEPLLNTGRMEIRTAAMGRKNL